MVNDYKKAAIISRLREISSRLDFNKHPFLYYLPKYITEYSMINPDHAVVFAETALKHEKLPIMKDALLILNRIVKPEDGTFMTPTKEIFYENRHFFWSELGGYTRPTDIISHIFNKI